MYYRECEIRKNLNSPNYFFVEFVIPSFFMIICWLRMIVASCSCTGSATGLWSFILKYSINLFHCAGWMFCRWYRISDMLLLLFNFIILASSWVVGNVPASSILSISFENWMVRGSIFLVFGGMPVISFCSNYQRKSQAQLISVLKCFHDKNNNWNYQSEFSIL